MQKRRVWLLAIVLGVFAFSLTSDAKPRPVKVQVYTGNPLHVVTPETRDLCTASVSCLPNSPHWTVDVSVTVKDVITGQVIVPKKTSTWILLYNHTVEEPITVPEKFGVYAVEVGLDFKGDPESNRTVTCRFAYFKPTGFAEPYKEGQFKFGINTHLPTEMPDLVTECKLHELIGARFVRTGISLVGTHPIKDVPPQLGRSKACMRTFRLHGIHPMTIMSSPARWALQNPEDAKKSNYDTHMPNLEVWHEFCKMVFSEFDDLVDAFELWNEPDLPGFAAYSANEYAELAKVTRKAHDEVKSKRPLMSAGFCTFDNEKGHFQEDAMRLCKDLFDVHCFHGHGIYSGFRFCIDKSLLPMRKKIGIEKMPWYAHETALTSTGNGEQMQAEAVWKKVVFSWSRGAIGYTWYNSRNVGNNPKNPEHNYGLVENDFSPKPAYASYNALIGLLNGDTTYVKEMSKDDCDIFLFKRNGNLILPMWLNTKGTFSVRTFTTDAARAESVDMYGNITPLPVLQGMVTIPVAHTPVALRLYNATKVALTDGPVTYSEPALLVQENVPTQFALKLKNPTSAKMAFDFNVEYPDGLRGDTKQSAVLTPNGAKTMVFKVMPAALSGKEASIVVRYTLNNSKEVGEITIPVSEKITLTKDFPSKPTAVLDRHDQVVETYDADPTKVDMLRKGNDDLKMDLYLAGDATALRIRAVVTDDIHHQKNIEPSLWGADSVQMYLDIPGKTNTEFGCALTEDGKVLKHVWSASNVQELQKKLVVSVKRAGNKTTYLVTMPWAAAGVTPDQLKKGVRFNILVNDDDFGTRECFMFWRPGVGNDWNSVAFPFLVVPGK